jgi:hypothetical protein
MIPQSGTTPEYLRQWRAKKAAEGKCHGCFNRGAGERLGKFRGTLTLCGLCAEERRVYGRKHYTPVPARVLKKATAAAPSPRVPKPQPLTREQRTAIRIEKLLAASSRLGRLENSLERGCL